MDKELIKQELHALIDEGKRLYYASIVLYDEEYFESWSIFQLFETDKTKFATQALEEIKDPHGNYYIWYGKACKVMQILAPKGLPEFENLYGSYIQKWLMGSIPSSSKKECFNQFESGFKTQNRILKAIAENIDHVLFSLETEIQYGFSKSGIEIAKELKENGHLREAGVIAGLVIELHLKKVAETKGIKLPTNPQMKHYNEALKGKAYDATITKQIELCSIIRNKCAHAGDTPPTNDDVNDIISIAEKIIATVS